MSVGVEVDALALMIDGVVTPIGRYKRKNVFWLEMLGTESALHHRSCEWPEVAEAILELEAWADWISSDADDSYCPETLGELGRAAHSAARGACKHIPRRPSIVFLEAAARLRDGWRPEGWRRQ